MPKTNDRPEVETTSGLLLGVSLLDVPPGRRTSTLIRRLRDGIRSGTFRPGMPLPASRTFAADLGVSRGVVVRAYEQLAAEGYLHAQQGSATRVAELPPPPTPPPPRAPPRPTNPGLPEGGTFPRAAWLKAAARAMGAAANADFGYGDPLGHPRLRTELAAYLGRVRSVLAAPEHVLVVNGFAQATRLLADVLRARGDTRIAVEDPGSPGLRQQLSQAGLTCVAVPVDAHGMCVDALDSLDVPAVVVTPAHQFPTGVVMAADRRHALLAWARANGTTVVEDDYDAELRYDRTPIGALQGIGADVVMYGGSVSKTLAPGLRLGWLVLPPACVDTFRDAKYAADLSTGVLDQLALAEFIGTGEMDRHIRRMVLHYRTRRDRLVTELERHLPDWQVSGSAAGLHLLLHPPPGSDEAALAALCRRCGLDARPLGGYALDEPDRPGVVVGYGHRSPAALSRSVHQVAAAVASS